MKPRPAPFNKIDRPELADDPKKRAKAEAEAKKRRSRRIADAEERATREPKPK